MYATTPIGVDRAHSVQLLLWRDEGRWQRTLPFTRSTTSIIG